MFFSRITPFVLIGIAGAAANAQTLEWAAPVDGDWSLASNWNPADVPDSTGEDAVLGHADPYTVGLSISAGIRDLAVVNPSARLSVWAARTLTLHGGNLFNDGLIELNPQNSSSNAILAFAAPTLLSGAGEIHLRTGGDNAQITGPGALTNDADHTIRGVGWINAHVINAGTIKADASVALSGDELSVSSGPMENGSVLGAESGSTLIFTSITVDQTAGGSIIAADGGVVEIGSGTSIVGGTFASQGAGYFSTVGSASSEGVVSEAHLLVRAATTLTVSGAGLTNNGLIELNSQNSSSNAILHFAEASNLDGSGEIQLRTSGDNSQITAASGEIVTHGASHLIRGVGAVSAGLVNNGELRADVAVALSGNELDLFGEPKVNNGLMSAAAGSRLDVTSTTIDQTGGGMLLAMDGGGEVRLGTGAAVVGGVISADGDGVCTTFGSPTLDSVTCDAPFMLNAANTVTVSGTGLINNGVMQLNNQNSSSNAILHFAASGDLGGTGEIQLRSVSNNSQITAPPAEVIHHHAGHLIRGIGHIPAGLVNDGEVRADVSVALSGDTLEIFGEPKVNNAVMAAAAGSRLNITSTSIDQRAGGALLAMDGGGEIRPGNGAVILGGLLDSDGDGFVSTIGSPTLEDVTNNALLFLNAAHTVTVSGSGLTNNGVITLNAQNSSSDASLRFLQSGTLGGSGEVRLLVGGNNSNISGDPDVVLTQGPGHTISGNGDINVDLINAGRLKPGNAAAGALDLNGDLDCEPSSVLESEIASTSSFDSLAIAGSATLGGTLEIIPIDSYVPTFGDAFTIVGASSIAGQFDTIDAPTLDDPLVWAVQYRPTQAILRVTCRADINVDGVVNTQDVLAFLNAWTAGDPRGDFNGDGSISTLDVLAFLNAWTTGC